MKRIGKFTGTVYDENYDFSKCPECCTCVSDEEAQSETFRDDLRIKSLKKCMFCMGCPAAEQ